MNSKIFFLGAIMLLPTFASCQQEKPFPDDAVDKVYEYLPEWQAGYLDIHQISIRGEKRNVSICGRPEND